MGKININDHPYANEFLEEISSLECISYMIRTFPNFLENVGATKVSGYTKKPLWTWLKWYLDWIEYTDFMEWKFEVEKQDE